MLLILCVAVLSVFHTTHADCSATQSNPSNSQRCGRNQHYEKCGTCPKTCDNYNDNPPSACATACVAGCYCNKNYVRNQNGKCVKPSQCPIARTQSSNNPVCGRNQHYESCGTCPLTCDNYYNPPSGCAAVCVSGCYCDEGYIRDPNGNCVNPNQCPGNNNPACPINERYNKCGTACPITCANIGNPPQVCNERCVVGCECANGYVRNSNGRCVLPRDCPSNSCPANEVYSTCVSTCNNCRDRGNCVYPCNSGCDCIRGYYRNASGVCIPEASCFSCSANEEYSNCVSTCNTCKDRGNCSYPCKSGCDCKRGYYRNANGSCIPEASCVSCSENEVYSTCVSPCNNCRDRGNCFYPCKNGCDCKRGYYRNAKGVCIPASSCPAVRNLSFQSNCPVNQTRTECGTVCPVNCNSKYGAPSGCSTECYKGCECKDGYIRLTNSMKSKCLKPEDCP